MCAHVHALCVCGWEWVYGCRLTAGLCLKDFWHVLVPAFFTLDWKHMLQHNRDSVRQAWREGPWRLPPHLAVLGPPSRWVTSPGREGGSAAAVLRSLRALTVQASGSVWIRLTVTSISTCFFNFIARPLPPPPAHHQQHQHWLSGPRPLTDPCRGPRLPPPPESRWHSLERRTIGRTTALQIVQTFLVTFKKITLDETIFFLHFVAFEFNHYLLVIIRTRRTYNDYWQQGEMT